jgi:peptidyl-prolyl cis-trans isomerase SurA
MTLRRLLLLSAALVPALASAALSPLPQPAPAATSSEPGATVIARVEDRIITLEDLRRKIYPQLDALRRAARTEKEFNDMLAQFQSDVLNDLINRLLAVHDFKKDARRRIPDSAIDDYIARTVSDKFGGDRAAFLQYLRENGWNSRDYREQAEEDIIYIVMREQHRKSETVVSPRQVEDFYNTHKDSADFRQTDAAHLRIITFNRQPGETDPMLLARVQPVLTRLNSGEKFETLAREVGDNPAHRANGGDLGWIDKANLIPQFATPAFTLEKGAFSGPILIRDSDRDACYLLFVEDRRAAGLKPLSEVSGIIQKELAAQLGREAEARWIARLRESYYVSVVLPSDDKP